MSDDNLSDDDFIYNYDSAAGGSTSERKEYHYEVLTTHKVLSLLLKEVEEVANTIQISPTTTRVLLTCLKWNKFDLIEQFFNNEDKLFRDTKVIKTVPKGEVIQSEATNYCEYCQICFNIFPVLELTGPECGHKYCANCWNEYLSTKILLGGIKYAIPCAAYNCLVLVEDEMCMALLKNFKAREIYENLIINSFVECSVTLRWCPNANCRKAIKVDLEQIDCKPVSCYCATTRFCFSCGKNWHSPIKCALLEEWTKLIDTNNMESFKWIRCNTKKCPKCGVNIQRSEGCNKMLCKNFKCNCLFCWECLQPLNGNHPKACKDSDKIIIKASPPFKDPEYDFLFYTNFMNNKKFLESDKILRERAIERTRELAKQGIHYMDRKILEEAPDILVRSRQTVMHAYVFDFFVAENDHFAVFKQNQTTLLEATETLSGLLKDSLESDFLHHNMELQRCTAYCDANRHILEVHIYEGYKKNWFQFKSDIFSSRAYL